MTSVGKTLTLCMYRYNPWIYLYNVRCCYNHTYPQALTEINEHKDKLQSVQELSSHLLFLEPIFDGKAVRDDLQTLANQFQNLVMEVFSILETQVWTVACGMGGRYVGVVAI